MHTCILKWKLSFLIQRKHLCKNIWESEVIYKSYSYMARKWVDCLWRDPEKSKATKSVFTCFTSSSTVLKLLLLVENTNTNAMTTKLFKSPGKLKGPTMECFKGKIEMSITIRNPFPRTRSLWSHFLFSGVSLDRVAAITPRRIWPHPKQNIQWTSRFLEHKL